MRDVALTTVQEWYRTGDAGLLSPDIEWRVLASVPSGGLYRGREEVVDRFFPAVKATFAAYEAIPKTFVAQDETVITVGFYRVRGKSGATIEADFAHIWTVRDEVIVSFRQIADSAAINTVS